MPDAVIISDPGAVPPAMSTSWNTRDIGYFAPNNAEKRHHYLDHGVTYFTNVYAFVNHLRSLQSNISMRTIRSNIHFCLRGKALDWYDVELSPEERKDLGNLPLEEGWYKRLIDRFQPLPDAVECAFWDASYGLEDARAGRGLVEWAHNILRHAQALEDTDIHGQLNQFYR